MSMISELVNRLRAESKSMGKYGNDYMATLLMRSADTIVMLSEKARTDTPQTDIHDLTDCDFCKDRNCKECEGGKDEPKTDCAWK